MIVNIRTDTENSRPNQEDIRNNYSGIRFWEVDQSENFSANTRMRKRRQRRDWPIHRAH